MKVCFVSLGLYPCLAEDYSSGQIGGAEIQQVQIARALLQQGVEVSAVTEDLGQVDGALQAGVSVYKCYKPGAGLPAVRFFHPKLTSIYQALKAADADVYYVRTASFLTSLVAYYCFRSNRRWVYAGAHDTDFVPGKELVPNLRDRYLYRRGLARSDQVIVQSHKQRELYKENYGKGSVVIRNFIDQESRMNSVQTSPLVLWVSTIRRWKRPELFLDMAKSLPELKFVMIGGADALDYEFYEHIENLAAPIDNLEFMGFQPFGRTEAVFDEATVVVNTSDYEGFPNTFLQAWRRGLPVVTRFDPDNVVQHNRLGCRVGSVDEAVQVLPGLIEINLDTSKHICNYFTENHSRRVIGSYMDVFERLL